MGRELGASIISLLAEQRSMTTEEISESLKSDAEAVERTLRQLKRSQWVIDTDEGGWRATRPRLG